MHINTYTCEKQHVLVTQRLTAGVTPTAIKCPVCQLPARSAGYLVSALTPTHEWYRPAHPERYASADMRQHVRLGGLVLREIGHADETQQLPTRQEYGGFARTKYH